MTPAWPCVWEAQVVEAYDKDAFHVTLPGPVYSTLKTIQAIDWPQLFM